MNCTHPNNETTADSEYVSLKTQCQRLRIDVPGDCPTLSEIIPLVKLRLVDLANHPAATSTEFSGDHIQWKRTVRAYEDFLAHLTKRMVHISPIPPIQPTSTHQNNVSPQKSPPSDSTIANQPSTADSKVIPGDSQVISGESLVIPGDSQPTSSDSNPVQTTKTNPPPPEEPFDIRQHLDAAALRVSADLQEYLSGRSPLDHLTPIQQGAILLLLEDHTAERVAQVLAQPEPHGMNFETSAAALNRFRRRIDRAQKKSIADLNDKSFQDLLSKAHESDEAFQAAIQRLIKTRLLRAANAPLSGLDAIDSMITSLTKLRKQTLAERKQLHAEKSK